MTLFDNVKSMANERGLSLLKLNEQAGLGKNAIYKWKTQTPSTKNLTKVAKVLGVTVDQLIDENKKNTSDDDFYELTKGLFRSVAKGKKLDSEETEELKDDFKEYLEFRANKLKNRRNNK